MVIGGIMYESVSRMGGGQRESGARAALGGRRGSQAGDDSRPV